MHFKYVFCGSTNLSLNFLILLNYLKFKFIFLGADCKKKFNILKVFCFKKNFIFFQFKNIYFYNNNFIYNIYLFVKIKKIWFNFFLIFDYWMIFSIFFFRIPYYGFLNVHSSNLPFYRGYCPIYLLKINKNFFFSFSLIFINKYIDFGFLNYKFIFFYNFFINYFLFLKKFFLNFISFFLKIFKFNFYFKFNQININNIFFYKKLKTD